MNPYNAIASISTQNQNVLNAYDSYITQNMYRSENTNELESAFINQCSEMKSVVEQKTNHVAQIAQSYCPDPRDPYYWQKWENYKVLAHYACAHIEYMDNSFSTTFSRLKSLFNRLSAWIRNKVTQVYTAVKGFCRGVVNRIRGWFS